MNRAVNMCLILITFFAAFGQTPNTLQTVFQSLVLNFGTPRQPKPGDILKAEEMVASMSPDEIDAAFPAIDRALNFHDELVQGNAAMALFAISRRTDSAELLKPYIPTIEKLFNSTSPRVDGLLAYTVLNLKAAPPPELLSSMLECLNNKNAASESRIVALAALVRVAPDDPEVVDSVVKFMAHPLNHTTRIAVLNAIHTSRINDPRVQNAVIAALDDTDTWVKFTAIEALDRMGPDALVRAKTPLKRLAQQPTGSDREKNEVKAAAQDALKQISARH